MPYRETIKGAAKAHGRYKKQTGGRGQFGDCHIEIEPLPDGQGFEFVNKIKGGVIPTGFIPAVEKGIVETMATGTVAGYPVSGVRVTLYDGSYHSVDSLGDGVQGGRLDGVQAGDGRRQSSAPRADHDRHGGGPRGLRRRRDRRPELAPRDARSGWSRRGR